MKPVFFHIKVLRIKHKCSVLGNKSGTDTLRAFKAFQLALNVHDYPLEFDVCQEGVLLAEAVLFFHSFFLSS